MCPHLMDFSCNSNVLPAVFVDLTVGRGAVLTELLALWEDF